MKLPFELRSSGDRNAAFTRELLAEADDKKLQEIVEEAARDLDTPIALVTMVMEHVQFFKAHYGLPLELANARGTDKDISFCQFVVESKKPFEIQDAKVKHELPQDLVDKYDIRAYLGMPIMYQNVVVGSLCVLDTKPRKFTEKQHKELQMLAELVNQRLATLTIQRKRVASSLLGNATIPALKEIKNAISPVHMGINAGHAALREIQTFLRIAEQSAYGKINSKEEILRPLDRAREVLKKCQNDLYNMEVSLEDAEDSLAALEQAFRPSTTTLISEISTSGRELARHTTLNSGGVLLPDVEDDLFVSTPRTYGITLVTTVLTMISTALSKNTHTERIRMVVKGNDDNAIITFHTTLLANDQLAEIVELLQEHINEEPTVSIHRNDQGINLQFALVKTRS